MSQIVHRYATPFITWLFMISLITGIALFVHIGPAAFREMHEILSMVLILPFALHLWKNWRPMMAYLRKPAMIMATAVSVAMMVPFFLAGEEGRAGGPPQFAFAGAVLANPVDKVAPLFGLSAGDLQALLGDAGYDVSNPGQSLHAMALAAGKSDADLAALLNGLSGA
jgi:hypothetical protein